MSTPQQSYADQRIPSRFAKLTAINSLTTITAPLASLVDTAMLGHLRDIRFLAGVALATIAFDYLYWSFGFLRMSTAGLTAKATGNENIPEVWRILYRALCLALLAGTTLIAFQYPLKKIAFSLLSGDIDVESAGAEYFDGRIWGAPAVFCNYVIFGWFIGKEQSGKALLLTAVANAANIALNYMFIVHLNWAATGAGIATAISQGLMASCGILLIFRQYTPSTEIGRLFDKRELKKLVLLNADIMVRTLCLSTASAIFTNISAQFGKTQLAANVLLLRLYMLAAYFIDGAALSAETLSGQYHTREKELSHVVRTALRWSLGLALAYLTLVSFTPIYVLQTLTSHSDVISHSLEHFYWLFPVLIAGSIAFAWDGIYIGLTLGKPLRNGMLVSFACFAPTAGLAWWSKSSHMLWFSLAVFLGARALTLSLDWKKRRKFTESV